MKWSRSNSEEWKFSLQNHWRNTSYFVSTFVLHFKQIQLTPSIQISKLSRVKVALYVESRNWKSTYEWTLEYIPYNAIALTRFFKVVILSI